MSGGWEKVTKKGMHKIVFMVSIHVGESGQNPDERT